MKALLALFVLAIAIILGVTLAAPLRDSWEQKNAYQAQVQALDLERQQTQLRDYQAQTQATATSRALVSNMGYLGAGLVGILVVMFGVDFYRQRRQPILRYDANRPLVSRRQIEHADPVLVAAMLRRLELGGQAEIARAVHQ